MLVRDIMKTAMATDKDISLQEASKVISSKGISSLIMIKKDKVIGIVTEEDFIENFGKDKKLSQVMSKIVVTISPEEKIADAIELMREHKISILPVIEDNELVGVISARDILMDGVQGEDFLFG